MILLEVVPCQLYRVLAELSMLELSMSLLVLFVEPSVPHIMKML